MIQVLAFGLHSLSHLGATALFRGYTPGAITAPIVVLPYWVWGWGKLNRAGVLRSDPAFWATAVVAVPVTIGGVHLAAAGLLKALSDKFVSEGQAPSPESAGARDAAC